VKRQRSISTGRERVVAMLATLLVAGPASAWESKGHTVIEALAYRTLVEGHGGVPPHPDVLRDLINDGALAPPWCFGRGDDPPGDCRNAPTSNPLLAWPQPETDRPDAFFRRQFSDPGQCFHYMATLADGLSDPLPGTSVPRALATSAVVRCNDLLDDLLRQVVVDGGPGTRQGGFGLYEMMHVVEDSFSGAHAQRAPGGVDFLRVWKPIEKVVGIPSERTDRIPDDAFHKGEDHRDKTYVVEGGVEACEARVDHPYNVPYSCLSGEGDQARQAIVELLAVVRDLRLAQVAAPAGMDTHPETSASWKRYRASWFTAVHPCEGAECDVREPPEPAPGRYAFVGLETRASTPGTFDVGVRGTSLRYAEGLNPFVYALSATLGYEYRNDGGNAGYLGLGFGLLLPLGMKAFIGLTPAELRVVYGASGGALEVLTRLLRLDYAVSQDLALTVEGPLSVNWVVPRADWTVAVGISYGLSSPRLVGGHGLVRHDERAERHDESWVPPPAPYGRLEGRRATFLAFGGVSPAITPADAVPGRTYGCGMVGAQMAWDRDRWGDRFAFSPVVSLAVGLRNTSGESSYLTGALGLGIRWTFLGPLGLSVTAVGLEGGPKIRGKGAVDGSTGVHGPPGGEYYLLAGSRIGLALRLGIADLLVESPTIAWTSDPFGTNEIVGFRIGIGL
jgi:hypothetical protein